LTFLAERVYGWKRKGNVKDSNFKVVQMVGPPGGCLIEERLDLVMGFDSLHDGFR
jgi:NADH:ubiquinone oxidoreductase subunit F (NADH-binding)